MKMFHNYKLLMALPLIFIFNACSKGIHENPKNSGINASSAIDKNLVNAWGIAFGPSGGIWVSANHTGLSTIYDIHGSVLRPPVTIPSSNNKGPGAPTGMVYNATSDFIIPANHEKGKFIFASEDGIIVAWSSGNSAIKVADRSAHHSVYKGLALANNGEGNFLYATDFSNGKIDIYDRRFRFVGHNEFSDPTIPIGYAPFNIQYLGGKFYVTYAKQKPDHHDDQSGPGNGYVNVFTPKGKLIKRFASRGILNSPWGIAQSEQSFCENESKIFVGNFGDGKINVFDVSGEYNGPLLNAVPIVIDGLWDLSFQPEYVHGRDINALFFTAGPNQEQHGLFGYIHCIQPY
jgi:uncharacterized protein (TIGR03118 family)